MLRHTVIFTLHPDTDEATRANAVERLRALASVPTVRRIDVQVDAGISERSADMILTADFDDADGWQAYQDHPDHVAFVAEVMAPIMAHRAAVQVEIDA